MKQAVASDAIAFAADAEIAKAESQVYALGA
jgi:hypothetical protein